MQTQWSIVSRIKSQIGTEKYKTNFGTVFQSLLDAGEFDATSDMVDKSCIKDSETVRKFKTHIQSYKYAC